MPLRRGHVQAFTYVCIKSHLLCVMADPELAKAVSSRPQVSQDVLRVHACARSAWPPPSLQDVHDGHVVKELVQADPRFANDSRHQLLMLTIDPFQWSADDAGCIACPYTVNLTPDYPGG
eukprot:365480-Chlamydomonas_euryale.AAC.1